MGEREPTASGSGRAAGAGLAGGGGGTTHPDRGGQRGQGVSLEPGVSLGARAHRWAAVPGPPPPRRPLHAKAEQHLMCEEHEDERINIYCLRCEAPTCSLCKVFGAHKDCEVAPLPAVYQRQKVGGPGGASKGPGAACPAGPHALPIPSCPRASSATVLPCWWRGMTGSRPSSPRWRRSAAPSRWVPGGVPGYRIQPWGHAHGGDMAGPGQSLSPTALQENGRRQKQHLGLRFDSLYSILEERKKELLQSIAREQEAKVQRVRGLIRQYGDHLEASSKLVESAIQAMEEPQMAVYLQVCAGRGAGAQDPPGGLELPQGCVMGPQVSVGAGIAPRGCAERLWSLQRIWGCPWDVLGWAVAGVTYGSWGPSSHCSSEALTPCFPPQHSKELLKK